MFNRINFFRRFRAERDKEAAMSETRASLPCSLAGQFIVLIGLMGAGKSNLGRRLAAATSLPFKDSDNEVEAAAGCSIEEIFERYGEQEFRDGERRVISRLFDGEPSVMATGGGAFMDPETRSMIKERGVSIWLRADLDLLDRRTQGRSHRPLLKNGNGRDILAKLIEERYPVYGEADIIFDVSDEPAPESAERLASALLAYGEDL